MASGASTSVGSTCLRAPISTPALFPRPRATAARMAATAATVDGPRSRVARCVQGTLWWRNDPDGNLYILVQNPGGGGLHWVPASSTGGSGGGGVVDPNNFVAKTGDTMTGALGVNIPATIGVGLLVSSDDAASIALNSSNNNQPVWQVTNSFVGQVGQTVGFNITRSTPAGAPVDTPFAIDNNSIITASTIRTKSGDPVSPDDLARKVYVDTLVRGLETKVEELLTEVARLRAAR
jgi:hypothetical protein